MENIRLQKYLADAGVASRRKCEELISAGRVSVNDQLITKLGTKVSTDDIVCVDGKPIEINTKLVYIVLHKPEGVITSVSDPQNRPVVLDLVKDLAGFRLYPVGRLDYDSSGLLLLTNDGKLAQKLTHPSNKVKKTYIAQLKGIPSYGTLQAFKHGLKIDDGPKTAPAKIKVLDKTDSGCSVQIIIHEGRNRQVRKMCQAIGCPVLSLKRVAVGSLKLGSLPRGKYRHLTAVELSQLKGN